jgi:uncharacterized protein (DUF1330 family)
LYEKFVQTNLCLTWENCSVVTILQQLRYEGYAMTAYMIVTAKIADRAAFIAGYGAVAADLVAKFGGKYVLRGPGVELLEGDFGDGASMVISEWPSKEAARAFWNSPEYGEAKLLRAGVAQCQVLLIEAPTINGQKEQ